MIPITKCIEVESLHHAIPIGRHASASKVESHIIAHLFQATDMLQTADFV